MRLVAGRDIADTDGPEAPQVALVNETFARALLARRQPDRPALLDRGDAVAPEARYEIVGVVKDAKYRRVREAASPVVYLAARPARAGRAPGWCAANVRRRR